MVARPEVRAALEHATPDLVAALERDEPRAWEAARRYVRRMAGRPAPFGLMAGVSVGEIGDATRLEVDPALRVVRGEARPDSRLAVNPALRDAGARLHLVDRALAARPTEPIRAVLAAAPGTAEALAAAAGVSARFVGRMLEAGLLVPMGGGAPGHLDALRDAPGLSLGPEVVEPLARAAGLLCALAPDRPPAPIRRFCERFERRYGDAEVPLLEALDPEGGLGLPDPEPEAGWSAREQRMLDAIAAGESEWVLGDDDLEALAPARPRPLPPAFSVLASVAADGLIRVHGVSGPPGGRLVARHGAADPRLEEWLRAHARAEETLDPGAVYAEVVRWTARDAPVVERPALREHEIVLRGTPRARAIAASDLTVRVVDGRPVLRSASLDRRVVPRISSAHDFRAVRDPVYRFLGLMQDPHGEGWVAWRWGALASAARLPRVRRGDVVLAPAQWRRPRVEDLPGWVCVVDRGRELPVPREEAAGAGLVRELLPPRGDFVQELIVPFSASSPAVAEPRPAVRDRVVFKPGGEWASIKLFCGPVTADEVLLEAVLPLVAGHQWYFLRYDDPEWHLRVRARGVDLAPLAGDERVWRAEVDTYVREVARYGDIGAAERCFHADSEAVAGLLGSGLERRHVAIAGVAALFEDAGAEAHFPGLGPSAAARLRAERPAVERVLAMGLFAERSARWRQDVVRVDLPSLAHMHVNRVLRSGHREEEPLVYDYLSRHSGARFSPKARTPSKKSSV